MTGDAPDVFLLLHSSSAIAFVYFLTGMLVTLLLFVAIGNLRRWKTFPKQLIAESELEDQLRFETLLGRISMQFINLSGTGIDEGITEALGLLGEYIGADRASLYLLSEDCHYIVYAKGWRTTAAREVPWQFRRIRLDELSWLRERLLRGETLWLKECSELPNEAHAERTLLNKLPLQSLLIAPLHDGDSVIGLIAFAFEKVPERWHARRLEQLGIAGKILSNALARKRNEEALKESESKFASLFRSIPVGILITRRLDGRFLAVNDYYLVSSGYNHEEIKASSTLEHGWLHPEDRSSMLDLLTRDGYVRDYRAWFYDRQERERFLELSVEVIRFGGEDALLSIVRDITERVQTEEALRNSEMKFAKAFHGSPDAVLISRLQDGLFIEVNPGYEAILGYTREEIIGRTSIETGQWVNVERRAMVVDALLEGRDVRDFEGKFRRKDGSIVDLLISCSLLEIDGEKCMLTVGRDITERKRAEEELRQSRQRLQLHMDRTPLGVLEFDRHGRTTAWNSSAERIFGYSKSEALGKDWSFIVPNTARADVQEIIDSVLVREGGFRSFNENITRDGRIIQCDWFNTPLIDTEGEVIGFASLCLDITDRVRAEAALKEANESLERRIAERTAALALANTSLRAEIAQREQADAALRESETRFRELVETTQIGYQALDLSGRFLDVNPGLCALLGYSRDELRGRQFDEFWVPGAGQLYANEFSVFNQELQATKELRLIRKDGARISVILEGRIQREPHNGGGRLHCFLIDITQHKTLTETLLRAKEAAEAGDRAKSMFIASMSHELRTPLNSIIGFTGILLQGISGDLNPEQRNQLERVYASSKHLLALICDVIDISKIEAGFLDVLKQTFDLRKVIDEAVAAVRPQANAKGLIIDGSAPSALLIHTDRKRLLQCFLNVLNNAVKYTEQGHVLITVEVADRHIKVRVADTGIGIEKDALVRLFQPFERLESRLRIKVPGTGLGLYLTRKILHEMLGGSISVQSTVGVGTTFIITLPYAASDADTARVSLQNDVSTLPQQTH